MTKDADEARERIEQARAQAAAYIVQRAPIDNVDSAADEQQLLDAVDTARDEDQPQDLERAADRAEEAATDIRREAYGRREKD